MPTYKYQCLECLKTYIGPELLRPIMCNCTPPKKMHGVRQQSPLSAELIKIINISDARKMRVDFCSRWNITNKSHATHGSNFSGNQKVVDLINDIVSTVQGGLRISVRQLIISEFSYDIDTCEMIN